MARLGGLLIYLRTMAVFLAIWWVAALLTANPLLLPNPWRVALALRDSAIDGDLLSHAAISLLRLLFSLAIATAIAVPLGLAMGTSRLLERLVDPVVEVLRPISGIAWIPLALFIFGIGHALPMFIMAYAAAFPILIGTIAAAKGVDPRLVDAARIMAPDHRSILGRVIVPGSAEQERKRRGSTWP